MYSGTTDYLRIGAGGMVTAIDVAVNEVTFFVGNVERHTFCVLEHSHRFAVNAHCYRFWRDFTQALFYAQIGEHLLFQLLKLSAVYERN